MSGESFSVIAVAIIVSVVAPLVTGLVMSRTRRADKRQEWARQDQVAAAAATERAILEAKVDGVKTLVDGAFTATMQSELNATTRELVSLRSLTELQRAVGRDPDPAAGTVIEMTEARIAELTEAIAARERAIVLAEAQVIGSPS